MWVSEAQIYDATCADVGIIEYQGDLDANTFHNRVIIPRHCSDNFDICGYANREYVKKRYKENKKKIV